MAKRRARRDTEVEETPLAEEEEREIAEQGTEAAIAIEETVETDSVETETPVDGAPDEDLDDQNKDQRAGGEGSEVVGPPTSVRRHVWRPLMKDGQAIYRCELTGEEKPR